MAAADILSKPKEDSHQRAFKQPQHSQKEKELAEDNRQPPPPKNARSKRGKGRGRGKVNK